ncbi:YbaK/EbsC family protein [Thermodesulforhabdus norvegica]|uniref:Cys-tRNA(Pro) deacylase, prolyl-tRNA editing enzyme YbaK/EbsC n=1 Tax=Thermodesulforhabdus norvegica TaxID=39841 RepID=A0A1I4UN80_9BACT|nr:YbaK/EbsC family protein [Thermodesulforhabdus norvegica]SFM90449.1 Cys-tRNA(Pro) deacylase, prolyl-tRNA editing enzyme YbaK/EbsC [Thermodesulforhabdus norvegica]
MASIQDVKEYLKGFGIEVWEFSRPTSTAEEAAQAVGCSVAEIAKTVLFIVGDVPVAVVTCGDLKVKGALLKKALNLKGKVRFPGRDEVRRFTGYEPGGVCPFLLPDEVKIVIDSSLRRFPRVYAAAGNDRSAVPITVEELIKITDGIEASVCES